MHEEIFRTQLAYFEDIDYSEQVIYKKGFSVNDEIVKKNTCRIRLREITAFENSHFCKI